MDFRKIAKKSAEILRSKKGRDILILDVRKISDFTDYLVLASGTSDTHIKTLLIEIEENIKFSPYKKETKHKTKWVVIDYGGVVVHIFHDAVRKFYNLEGNWAAAKKVVIKPQKKHRIRGIRKQKSRR
ncbi:MAG: ribosome silencing factor [Elusimicrobia bacterium]|nr:ribosome silencing factor [Elusimicrobiota bacterium]